MQKCEVDARYYAKRSVEDYFRIVAEYMEIKN